MMGTTRLEFGGLRSSVVIDGSDVRLYGVQHDEGTKTATSWIISEPDKHFSIHSEVINRIPGKHYAVKVLLDGRKAVKRVLRAQHSSVIHVKSIRVSLTETRKFMFGSLELSDDDALLETSSVEALGEIKILLYKVGAVSVAHSDGKGRYDPTPPTQKVHERAKKGLVHGVKYGGTQLDPLDPSLDHYKCRKKKLIASHIIRYRPLATLQANGVVPYISAKNPKNASKSASPALDPSSSRTSKKRKALREADEVDVKPVIDLDDDDYQDTLRKQHELKEQLTQLQEKKGQHQGRQSKKVKQEGIMPISHGEIIDLTI